MRRAIALLALLQLTSPLAAQQDENTLRPNTVRVQGASSAGFGFIVGLADRAVLIATAWHTVATDADTLVQVCFHPGRQRCQHGEVVYVDDPAGPMDRGNDLAIIRTRYPDGLMWRPDVVSNASAGTPVRLIGRGGDWFIPTAAGSVVDLDGNSGLLRYRGLPVAAGVSGAPIVSGHKIVAMHVSSDGDLGQGVPIETIRFRVVERMQARWALTEPGNCARPGAAARDFSGITVRLLFAGNSPSQGIRAAALLRCAGIEPLLVPVWDGAPRAQVRYPSGGLRLARVIQGLLAEVQPLDAELGNGDVIEVGI